MIDDDSSRFLTLDDDQRRNYSRAMAPNPHRTDHCPRGHRCESCGAEASGLAVVTLAVLGEVMCVTLCPSCAASGRPPQVMLSTAERLVAAHRRHLFGHWFDRPDQHLP
jgi:hypothetical protein